MTSGGSRPTGGVRRCWGVGAPQQYLNFCPDPQGHLSLRRIFTLAKRDASSFHGQADKPSRLE
jgi:hypothetical protein